MNKTKTRKHRSLRLDAETLRPLDAGDLELVDGGVSTDGGKSLTTNTVRTTIFASVLC
jgi:hypothetical protein